MKRINILLAATMLIMVAACKEEILGPTGDGNAPAPVTNTLVENLPGAAKISYTLPKDPNLLYVKAVYEINGVKMEERASYFNNNLTVQGFGDTRERDVVLYAVSRNEKPSEAVTVKVKPLPPAIEDIYNSLVVINTFGGINVTYKNIYKAKVVIEVLLDSAGEWRSLDAEYTELQQGDFSSRGLPPVERTFGLFVRDRWNNRSDTLTIKRTPVPEELLPAPTYKRNAWPIPQRAPLPASGLPMVSPGNLSSWTFDKMFNDIISSGDGFHTNEKLDQPIWLPFDLGRTTKLSRYKIWQRQAGYIYNHGNPHRWELWGSNNPTDTSSWVLLGSYVMAKPSGGESPGAETSQDADVAAAGQEYDFLVSAPAVRYVAWKNIDSWGNIGGEKGFFHLTEMKIWGQRQ
ncbi:DUF5000 domain-containing lipoprotein [Paraflavitalea sp. CAU 1676]|uniref:DUF4959 domain-containing protein n=1 Tax=Paraflavitalea sp. CAU 1676 TaxID=3032598 RepID=UPI0023DC09E9|nr:DUF5000 domain-containing lipoprotein [Paraflavitalea sp. CAU 1676]MDF2193320.1 DUF4959 domain-containing protein [Paraflavitalea sp. CAU 1676]